MILGMILKVIDVILFFVAPTMRLFPSGIRLEIQLDSDDCPEGYVKNRFLIDLACKLKQLSFDSTQLINFSTLLNALFADLRWVPFIGQSCLLSSLTHGGEERVPMKLLASWGVFPPREQWGAFIAIPS